jgi:hypothetical protein
LDFAVLTKNQALTAYIRGQHYISFTVIPVALGIVLVLTNCKNNVAFRLISVTSSASRGPKGSHFSNKFAFLFTFIGAPKCRTSLSDRT